MFEAVALGCRIAAVGQRTRSLDHTTSATPAEPKMGASTDPVISTDVSDTSQSSGSWKALSMTKKLLMALAFAVTTPIGMAIGIGVLNTFNGNDPQTLIAIGTLDALSAGVLVWVGVVEMWAGDWMFGGELANASPLLTTFSFIGLLAGMIIMSVLGKWA
jgi:solute carrier family 39 (zinc transporter), member 1/2/3